MFFTLTFHEYMAPMKVNQKSSHVRNCIRHGVISSGVTLAGALRERHFFLVSMTNWLYYRSFCSIRSKGS